MRHAYKKGVYPFLNIYKSMKGIGLWMLGVPVGIIALLYLFNVL